MKDKQGQRPIKPQDEKGGYAEQLTSLAAKTQKAYEEALGDFRDAQTGGSPFYFMGRE